MSIEQMTCQACRFSGKITSYPNDLGYCNLWNRRTNDRGDILYEGRTTKCTIYTTAVYCGSFDFRSEQPILVDDSLTDEERFGKRLKGTCMHMTNRDGEPYCDKFEQDPEYRLCATCGYHRRSPRSML